MAYTDPTTMLPVLTKQPGESLRLDLPVGPRMRTGDTISTVDGVTATVVSPGAGTVTVTGAAKSGTTVQATYAGGTHGEKYVIEATVTTTGGDTIKADAMLYVRD